MIDCKNGVYCVDSGYEGEGVAAIYIITGGGRTAIVDTANNASLGRVLGALGEIGAAPGSVDYIFLTHVHLDHAGGAGLFMKEMEQARLVVHSRGARHMIDPEKLIKGTVEVYGASEAERLYGTILPVERERVISPGDGEEILVGGRPIVCMDTPGHAYHHLAFHDRISGSIFTGDAFGLSCFGAESAIMPTTSPVQFDPAAMHKSIDRIISARADHLYLAHFGEVGGKLGKLSKEDAAETLHRMIDEHVRIATESAGDAERIGVELRALFKGEIEGNGGSAGGGRYNDAAHSAVEINALGLASWYAKTHAGDGA